MNSYQKRRTAKAWYYRIQYSRYGNLAYRLKKRGWTYCELMDYFSGVGMK